MARLGGELQDEAAARARVTADLVASRKAAEEAAAIAQETAARLANAKAATAAVEERAMAAASAA